MIYLQKNFYQGKGVGYSQLFGRNPDWYARFGLKGHNGIDIPLPTGTKLLSCLFGNVTEIYNDTQGYGLYVKIENDGCGVIYAHMQKVNVKVGDFVTAGQLLGYSNNTGNSTGPHLHFGVFSKPRDRQNGYGGYIDPLNPSLVEWVDELKRPDDPQVPEPDCSDIRESRDKWKQKTFDTEETLATERKEHGKEVASLVVEIDRLKTYIETSCKGQVLTPQEEKILTLIRILLFGGDSK